MSIEQFGVKFHSVEQDFIFNFGVNKGYSLSYSKVNRCYFLSAEAKQLYHNICDYAWGTKRDCHPCQATLRTELGWSRHSLDKYLDELRETGLIFCESQGANKPLIYHITELWRCPIIIHSEMVHELRLELGVIQYDFLGKLVEYRQSELCARMNQYDDSPFESCTIEEHYKEVKAWFSGEAVQTPSGSLYDPTVKVPKGFDIDKQIELTAIPDDQPKKTKKQENLDMSDPANWNMVHFNHFFSKLYEAKFRVSYPNSGIKKDVGQLKRLLSNRHDLRPLIKRHMERFMELDYFSVKTLAIFCSNHTQSVLDNYALTGNLPNAKFQSELAIPQDGDDDNDEFQLPTQRGEW